MLHYYMTLVFSSKSLNFFIVRGPLCLGFSTCCGFQKSQKLTKEVGNHWSSSTKPSFFLIIFHRTSRPASTSYGIVTSTEFTHLPLVMNIPVSFFLVIPLPVRQHSSWLAPSSTTVGHPNFSGPIHRHHEHFCPRLRRGSNLRPIASFVAGREIRHGHELRRSVARSAAGRKKEEASVTEGESWVGRAMDDLCGPLVSERGWWRFFRSHDCSNKRLSAFS
jgi:hypothetical protein